MFTDELHLLVVNHLSLEALSEHFYQKSQCGVTVKTKIVGLFSYRVDALVIEI